MSTEVFECAGCGAPLHPEPGAGHVQCQYCGRSLRVDLRAHTTAVEAALQAPAPDDLVDRLLRGSVHSPQGAGRRLGVGDIERAAWIDEPHALWPKAARASSTFGGSWKPEVTIGPPRVYPKSGDRAGAWAPGTRRSRVEWLECQFDAREPIRAIRVFETHQAGSTYALTTTEAGRAVLLYAGAVARGASPQILEVEVSPPRPIDSVRVWVSNDSSSGWSEIDTVALIAAEPLAPERRVRPEALAQARVASSGNPMGCVVAIIALAVLLAMIIVGVFVSGSGSERLPTPASANLGVQGRLSTWTVPLETLDARGVSWAGGIIEVSSEYSDARNAAADALGRPDVFPQHGDVDGAWASRSADAGGEFIEVSFPSPVRASAIVWAETNAPGAITRVDDTSMDRAGEQLWAGNEQIGPPSARIVSLDLPAPRVISSVRLVLDTTRVTGWPEIDAIGLLPAE